MIELEFPGGNILPLELLWVYCSLTETTWRLPPQDTPSYSAPQSGPQCSPDNIWPEQVLVVPSSLQAWPYVTIEVVDDAVRGKDLCSSGAAGLLQLADLVDQVGDAGHIKRDLNPGPRLHPTSHCPQSALRTPSSWCPPGRSGSRPARRSSGPPSRWSPLQQGEGETSCRPGLSERDEPTDCSWSWARVVSELDGPLSSWWSSNCTCFL